MARLYSVVTLFGAFLVSAGDSNAKGSAAKGSGAAKGAKAPAPTAARDTAKANAKTNAGSQPATNLANSYNFAPAANGRFNTWGWNARYNTYLYWNTAGGTRYYWYAPDNMYLPESYAALYLPTPGAVPPPGLMMPPAGTSAPFQPGASIMLPGMP